MNDIRRLGKKSITGSSQDSEETLRSRADPGGLLELGDSAEQFLRGLTSAIPKLRLPARYILRMKEHYQSEDIHRAIEHAIRYQALSTSY